jgi:hypothetical protein
VGVALFLLNRWASKRMVQQQDMIERSRQPASIYVIDKKMERIRNANFPKVVYEQMPKWNRFMKVPLVKAKIGPQIMTLMCDRQVFDVLPIKKTVKVELAGIYISSMKGMKTKKEMREFRRSRKGEAAEASTPWYKRIIKR